MPELPEVEVFRRNLSRWVTGRRLAIFEAEGGRTIAEVETVTRVDRHGKKIALHRADGSGVGLQFGVTGKVVRPQGKTRPPFTRYLLTVDADATVCFVDPRRLGTVSVSKDSGAMWKRMTEGLGRDPLLSPIGETFLRGALSASTRAIKVALMDQTKVAGIGNIQASEALHRAGILPSRPCCELTPQEFSDIARGVHASIESTISELDPEDIVFVHEDSKRNRFEVYRREGRRCHRCASAAIVRTVLAGRATFFCPACQK